jgi:pimeloyl-ACP methyl ester carboxylesterase
MPSTACHRVELSGGALEYRVAGPADSGAPPVVFVHGLLVDHQLWTGVADLLAARGVRSYAPDWPLGSHRIPLKAEADVSPRGIAAMVHEFLAALDLTDVTLVGNDTGGAVCQFVIDADAIRIGRLVLTNCDAFDVFPPPEFGGLISLGRHAVLLRVMGAALSIPAFRHSGRVYGLTFARPPDPTITRSWVGPLLNNGGIRRDTAKFLGQVDRRDLLDVSARFERFTKPVDLVWGDDDRFFPISFAERLAAAFPNATLTTVPGARTFVPLEFPEPVADAIAKLSS